MNTEIKKQEIEKNLNRNVRVKVNGLRNKTNIYIGKLTATYPQIFTVLVDNDNKSFSYAELITGDVEIEYM